MKVFMLTAIIMAGSMASIIPSHAVNLSTYGRTTIERETGPPSHIFQDRKEIERALGSADADCTPEQISGAGYGDDCYFDN